MNVCDRENEMHDADGQKGNMPSLRSLDRKKVIHCIMVLWWQKVVTFIHPTVWLVFCNTVDPEIMAYSTVVWINEHLIIRDAWRLIFADIWYANIAQLIILWWN